jgi:predicted MFS family arabinose efflux permease
MMLTADVVRIVVTATLAALVASEGISVQALVVISCAMGAGEALFLPASFSVMPSLVEEQDLSAGNGILFASTRLAAFAGPALGGLVVAASGSGFGFGLNAVSFALSASALYSIVAGDRSEPSRGRTGRPDLSRDQDADPPPAATKQPRMSLSALLRGSPVVWLVLVASTLANLALSAVDVVGLPAYSRDALELDALGFGLILAALGTGEVIGSLSATRFSPGARPNRTASIVFVTCGIATTFLAWASNSLVAAVILVTCGAAIAYGNVVAQTAVQRWTPPHMIGKMSGVILTASFGVQPFSAALGSVVIYQYGVSVYFVAAGGVFAAIYLLCLTSAPFRNFGRQAVRVT